MKNFFLSIAMLTLCCCTHVSHDEQQVHKIISDFSKIQEKQHNLEVAGTGSAMPDKVQKFIIRFISHEKLYREEAKTLILDCAHDLLIMINEDEIIRPYLIEYPFTLKEIDMVICFLDGQDQTRTPPYIALVGIQDGYMGFFDFDPLEKQLVYKDFEELK
jgi:protein-arginine kinase